MKRGHALPECVQARAFAGHLEQGIAFQRRAHHIAAERRLAIAGLFQQAAQAGGARAGLFEVGEIEARREETGILGSAL
ncbi:MAG: hypothetical protein ACREXK_07750 [Gammaproteobacteria bacterium]